MKKQLLLSLVMVASSYAAENREYGAYLNYKKELKDEIRDGCTSIHEKDNDFELLLKDYVDKVLLSEDKGRIQIGGKIFTEEEVSNIREELRIRYDYPVNLSLSFENAYKAMKETGRHTKPAFNQHYRRK